MIPTVPDLEMKREIEESKHEVRIRMKGRNAYMQYAAMHSK